MRRKHEERKRRGLCIRCGNPASGKTFCEECLAARRQSMREWYRNNPGKALDYSVTWKTKNRNKNLCVTCGQLAPVPGRLSCEGCLKKARKRAKANQENRKAQDGALRLEVFGHYGGAICACCGCIGILFLSLDHVDNNGAEHRRASREQKISITGIHFYARLKKQGFPPGFQVLCMNCNIGKHRNGGICPHKQKEHV